MNMQVFETRAATLSCLLVAATGLIFGSAGAAAATPGWYAGFAIGRTVVNESVGIFASDSSSERQSFLLRGGYRISDHFAVELGLTRATGFDWSPVGFATGPGVPAFSELDVKFDVSSAHLGAAGILPFGRIWEAYAKLGVLRYRGSSHQRIREAGLEATTFTRDVKVNENDSLRAIGIGANVNERWHVRLEFQWFRLSDRVVGVARFSDSDLTVDSWTVGFDRRF